MLKATTGTWINYATTLAFQILFAHRFGSGNTAAAFQLTYAAWVAITAIFSSTLTTVLVPRLATEAQRAGIRKMLWLVFGLIWLVCVVIVAAADPIAHALHGIYELPEPFLARLVRLTAAMVAVQTLCDLGIACAIAKGGRFLPTLAPAGPSTFGAVALLAAPAISAGSLYLWLIVGSLAELCLVAPALGLLRGARRGGEAPTRVTFATMAQYALTSSLAPIELLLASVLASPPDSAHYAYAVRSLAVAQQLIIGGVVVALLGDWGRDILQRTLEVARRQLADVVSLVVVVLAGAVAIAFLLGHQLIELLYQHGAFTAFDTTKVYQLLLVGLAGFALDAVSVTVSSMLLARQRNDLAIRTGYVRFAFRLAALVAGASVFGIVGVPVAWGLASCLGLALNLRWLAVEHVALDFGRVRVALTVFAGVVAAAAALAALLPQTALAGRLAGALVAAGVALLALRSVRPRTA